MAQLQLIGGPRSNFVWTTRIMLAEKGVAYDLVPVPPHTPDVVAIHPFGKIPAMRHGDFTLCESRAICGYVDRTFPGPSLVPADPQRAAKVEQWISLICTTIDPVLVRQYVSAYVFPGTADGSPNRAAIDKVLPVVEKHLGIIARGVATGYLVGDVFTLADAYLFPIVYYMSRMPESGKLVANTPALSDYLNRLSARPSIRDTTPEPLSNEEVRELRRIATAAAAR